MVYDWDVHQKTCYQLYIDEGRSLEDIMEHMRTIYKFTPSKRAFQTQFKRWNFPSKQKPAYKNERLVNRIRELWEKNLTQREILRILNEEDGFDIKPRELMRVRARNRWLLRVSPADPLRPLEPRSQARENVEDIISPDEDGDSTLSLPDEQSASLQRASEGFLAQGPREQEDEDLNASAEKNEPKNRKRNRPPVNNAGPSGRFPSEMTLDQARKIMGVDSDLYREIRSSFRKICAEEGISKKTLAGPEKWDAAKDRLIDGFPQLQQNMWVSKDNLEDKRLALDIVCIDITKRMRTMVTRMSLAEAKNILGLNPEACREARWAFYKVICETQLTCKSDTSPEGWEELKRKWVERAEPFQALISAGADLTSQESVKAIELLAVDVMKRLRDDRARKSARRGESSPSHQPQLPSRPQPQDQPSQQQEDQGQQQREAEQPQNCSTPPESLYTMAPKRSSRPSRSSQADSSSSPDQADLDDAMGNANFDAMSEVSHTSHMPFDPAGAPIPTHLPLSLQPQANSLSDSPNNLPQPHRVLGSSIPTAVPMQSQMSPSLVLAANPQVSFMEQQYVQQPYAATATSSSFTVQPMSTAIAVFLKLHPTSTFVTNTFLWIGTISSVSLQSLRETAVDKFPNAVCGRVEGIVKHGKGAELPLHIQDDAELGAYLDHLQGSTPTFSVQLLWKT